MIAATIERVSTRKDRTVSVTIGSQELTPSKAGELLSMANKLVCVYISPKETMKQAEIDQVDQMDPEFPGRSQSQRIRNVLFVLWEKKSEGFKDFDSFYRFKTEAIIDNFKSQID